jgi:hypothetical protein
MERADIASKEAQKAFEKMEKCFPLRKQEALQSRVEKAQHKCAQNIARLVQQCELADEKAKKTQAELALAFSRLDTNNAAGGNEGAKKKEQSKANPTKMGDERSRSSSSAAAGGNNSGPSENDIRISAPATQFASLKSTARLVQGALKNFGIYFVKKLKTIGNS